MHMCIDLLQSWIWICKLYLGFQDIQKFYTKYCLKNLWINIWLVCSHLNAFFSCWIMTNESGNRFNWYYIAKCHTTAIRFWRLSYTVLRFLLLLFSFLFFSFSFFFILFIFFFAFFFFRLSFLFCFFFFFCFFVFVFCVSPPPQFWYFQGQTLVGGPTLVQKRGDESQMEKQQCVNVS